MEIKTELDIERLMNCGLYKRYYGYIEDSNVYIVMYKEELDKFVVESLDSIMDGKGKYDCMLYSSNDVDSLLYKLLSLKREGVC